MRRKALLAALIVLGAIFVLAGFYAFTQTKCACPAAGLPNNCVCLPSPGSYISFFSGILLLLAGIAILFPSRSAHVPG